MMETVIRIGPVEISTRDLRAFADFFLSLMLLYFGYQLGIANAYKFADTINQKCPMWHATIDGTHIIVSYDQNLPPTIPQTIPINDNQYIPPPG